VKDKPKYLAQKGDLLFNRTNSKELVGKTAVFEEDKPMAIAGYLVRIRANERGNNYYLSAYLNSAHGKKTLVGMCKSIVGMANINAQEVQNIKIVLPPIQLQNEFEKIVKATKQKLKNFDKSSDLLNDNFNSLSQKAFAGEL
jgi:type I restriction enzyme S subunit